MSSLNFIARASGHESQLASREFGVVVLQAREQMAVAVEGHLDRAMAEERLQPLRREALLDEPRRAEVPQRMQPILRLAVLAGDPLLDLKRIEAPVRDVGVVLDVAAA